MNGIDLHAFGGEDLTQASASHQRLLPAKRRQDPVGVRHAVLVLSVANQAAQGYNGRRIACIDMSR